MAEERAKEKYFSFAPHQPQWHDVCGTGDTHFLDVEEAQREDRRTPEETIPIPLQPKNRSGKLSPREERAPEASIPIVHDNFLGRRPHFHSFTLYETKHRFFLIASQKESAQVSSSFPSPYNRV